MQSTFKLYGQLKKSVVNCKIQTLGPNRTHRVICVRLKPYNCTHKPTCLWLRLKTTYVMPATRNQNPKHMCEFQTLQSQTYMNQSLQRRSRPVRAKHKERRIIMMMMSK